VLSDYGQVPCTFGQSSNAAVPLCSVGSADGGGDASFAISSFTTTTWSDQQAPGDFDANSAGISAASCYSSACCGPYSGFLATLGWSRVDDAGGMVYYEVSSRGSLVAAPVLGTSATGFLPCAGSTGAPAEASFTGTPGDYEVVAVDLAGNRSRPHAMPVAINCNLFDGGLTPTFADAAAERASDVPVAQADAGAAALDAAGAEGLGAEAGLGGLDAGPAAGADAGAARDVKPDAALVADVAAVGRDAVTARDAVFDDLAGARATGGDSGCSCAVAGRSQGMRAWVIGGLALALAVAMRRRRR
jgi:MYXO-CTERM domain-containing protein